MFIEGASGQKMVHILSWELHISIGIWCAGQAIAFVQKVVYRNHRLIPRRSFNEQFVGGHLKNDDLFM